METDQGVTGGVLVMDSFLNDFREDYGKNTPASCRASANQLPTYWFTFTTLYNVVCYLGCIAGAFGGDWIADKCGRRVTCFSAGLLFCVGTLWIVLTPARAHTALLVGRVVQGMGVGNSSFSLPLIGAEMECSWASRLRGFTHCWVPWQHGRLGLLERSCVCDHCGDCVLRVQLCHLVGTGVLDLPPEMFSLDIRAKGVSVSAMTNWSVDALMIGIPKLFLYLNVDGVFFLFAALCVCAGMFVHWMCPETKGILLEDIEALFDGFVRRPPRVPQTPSVPSPPKYVVAETPNPLEV